MPTVAEKIEATNELACQKMVEAQPVLVDVKKAMEVIAGMRPNLTLHSGSPITWGQMCQPTKKGVIGAILFEGLAEDAKEAEAAVQAGEIPLAPCYEHQTVGSMAGITSASTFVFKVKMFHVDWQPAAGGNKKLQGILAKLVGDR